MGCYILSGDNYPPRIPKYNDAERLWSFREGGHKEINRTNLSLEEIEERMKLDVVKKQFSMLQFRNTFPAFGFEAEFTARCNNSKLEM